MDKEHKVPCPPELITVSDGKVFRTYVNMRRALKRAETLEKRDIKPEVLVYSQIRQEM